MKRPTLLAAALLAFLLAGCGGGGGGGASSDTAESPGTRSVVMEPGIHYPVREGDVIEKRAPDTVVVLESGPASGETTATLESGAAVIVR
jgi:hypothetical protein